MSRTTGQWEQLLEGATPGPWRWYWDNGIISLEGAETVPIATDLNVWDSDVLAAAPETVAEVIRLRRELEQLRDSCIDSAETDEKNARFSHTSQALEARADELRDTAHDLTRILNGESNV